MTKALVWEFSDGAVAYRELAEYMRLEGESDEDFAARIVAKTTVPRMTPKDGAEAMNTVAYEARMAAMPTGGYGVFHGVVDTAMIPSERTFRNAWKLGAGKVEHDISKCKEIAHAKRRTDRAEAFKPLDIEATIPAKAAQAEALRQQIREKDAMRQAAIDAATTVEQLKALLAP